MNPQQEILKLRVLRNDLLNNEDEETEKQVDNYTILILDLLRTYFYVLPFEFVIEELSYLGHAPNLLYDDNGHWCVTGGGFQNVALNDNPIDMEMAFFEVEAKHWDDTPREALFNYLKE